MLLSNFAFNGNLRPSNLELAHIYCQQADYPRAHHHYEYAAHNGGGGVSYPKVPKFAPAPGRAWQKMLEMYFNALQTLDS